MNKWREAALRYQAVVDKGLPRPSPLLPRTPPASNLIQAAAELETFLQSAEGQDALFMVRAADQAIGLGLKNHGNGYGTSYFLDGYGLRRIMSPLTGEAIASPNPQPPQSDPISAIEAVVVLTNPDWGAGVEASDVVDWLQDQLACIANWSHNAEVMFRPD